jgi:hypothetical protein
MSGGGDLVTDSTAPAFGLWYDFAPAAGRCRETFENMRLSASELAPRVRDTVKA